MRFCQKSTFSWYTSKLIKNSSKEASSLMLIWSYIIYKLMINKRFEAEINMGKVTKPSSKSPLLVANNRFFKNSESSILAGDVLEELLFDSPFSLWWWGPISFILNLLGDIIPVYIIKQQIQNLMQVFPKLKNSKHNPLKKDSNSTTKSIVSHLFLKFVSNN